MNSRLFILFCLFLHGCALLSKPSPSDSQWTSLPAHCNSIADFTQKTLKSFSKQEQNLLRQWSPHRTPTRQERNPVEKLSELYIKECSQSEVIELTKALVSFQTTREGDEAKEAQVFGELSNFLKQWSLRAGLQFQSDANNTVFQLSTGVQEGLLTYVMHADVVPVGTSSPESYPPGWHTAPYEATIEDGKLIGRGTQDDKGPIAASMVALRILKQFQLAPKARITILLGTDEESSWKYMSKFAKEYPHSKYTISVDAEFPAVFGQNGFVSWHLFSPKATYPSRPKRPELVSAHGGLFATQIPANAMVTIRPGAEQSQLLVRQQIETTTKEILELFPDNAYQFEIQSDFETNDIRVQCTGKASHSSKPEEGHNALWPIALLTTKLNLSPSPEYDMLKVITSFFLKDLHGNSLGVAYSSPLMGPLVSSATVLRTTPEGAQLSVNMRRPDGKTVNEFRALLDKALVQIQKKVNPSITNSRPPYVGKVHLTNPNNELLPLLSRIYAQTTGDTHSKPHSIRGGTYAKLFPGAVDFGPSKPGNEYRGHAPNEYIELETLAQLTQMLYKSMLELSKTTKQP